MMRNSSPARVLLACFVLLSAWWSISVWLARPILPSPATVLLHAFTTLWDTLLMHAGYSLMRIAGGLVLALLVGVPLGVWMGYFPIANRMLSPFVYLCFPIPKIALLPVVLLFFGLGERSKICIVFLIIVFQIVIAIRDAIRSIPAEMFYALQSLGASFSNIFREVLLPASLPKLMTAFRVAIATSISVLFFTETIGTQYGIGYFIMDAWLRVNYIEMYAGIVALSLIGLALFALLDAIERALCRWQTQG